MPKRAALRWRYLAPKQAPGLSVAPAQRAQEGDSTPYPVPNGLYPRLSTMPPPGLPVAPARRQAQGKEEVSACVQIDREEIEKAGHCIVDETRRLISNRTEAATVLAAAIIGPCRITFLHRMSLRSQSFQCDFLKKTQDDFFAEMRSHVISSIVGLRTDLQNLR